MAQVTSQIEADGTTWNIDKTNHENKTSVTTVKTAVFHHDTRTWCNKCHIHKGYLSTIDPHIELIKQCSGGLRMILHDTNKNIRLHLQDFVYAKHHVGDRNHWNS